MNLFRQVELGFDKLFSYNRQQTESFDYHNTMKNSSISEQLKLQEQKIQDSEKGMIINQENMFSFNLTNKEVDRQAFNTDKQTDKEQNYNILRNHSTKSLVGFLASEGTLDSNPNIEEQQQKKIKRKRKFPKL